MTWSGMAVAIVWSAVLIWAVFHVEAAERERCAKIADDYAEDSGVCAEIAARIREGK